MSKKASIKPKANSKKQMEVPEYQKDRLKKYLETTYANFELKQLTTKNIPARYTNSRFIDEERVEILVDSIKSNVCL